MTTLAHQLEIPYLGVSLYAKVSFEYKNVFIGGLDVVFPKNPTLTFDLEISYIGEVKS